MNDILLPNFALALLTLLVWVRMYVVRVAEMRAKRISPNKLSGRGSAAALLSNTQASDNFSNLFELPVLFYVLTISLYVTHVADGTDVLMAWGFVLLRCGHSIVHCSYNTVMHRFYFYLASSVVLWAMWMRLAWRVVL